MAISIVPPFGLCSTFMYHVTFCKSFHIRINFNQTFEFQFCCFFQKWWLKIKKKSTSPSTCMRPQTATVKMFEDQSASHNDCVIRSLLSARGKGGDTLNGAVFLFEGRGRNIPGHTRTIAHSHCGRHSSARAPPKQTSLWYA